MELLKPIQQYIEKLDVSSISEERKALLQPLIDYLNSKKEKDSAILLNFICTHNSRRSHFAQIWAQAMAAYYSLPNIECFSGGTETTSLFPMVATTLEATGFKISKEPKEENPLYKISFSETASPILGFSKTYDAASNPKTGFAAIMTCSQADAGCPFVAGSDKRISITYEDPKVSDGTPKQKETYLDRSQQIATELKYVFSKIDN
ncbi:protein-tyrosine-phosphatase [Aequorivita sp. Q41]|uniref:arsenate-mycothiol transferase ArsC n=1 Tax=Aequorivita sp. Q41 TaxID=3153300 RepID=UPI003242CBE6